MLAGEGDELGPVCPFARLGGDLSGAGCVGH